MYYYPFHIGDYAKCTRHLELLEDLAYRRLLDLYYQNEAPFNDYEPEDLAREIGMKSHVGEVIYILSKYFPGGVNNRADEIIAKFQKQRDSAKKAGQASGKARRAKASERSLNKCSSNVEPTNNHKPITNNQKRERAECSTEPNRPSVDEVNRFANKLSLNLDGFHDYYESMGWCIKPGVPVVNWKPLAKRWHKRGIEYEEKNKSASSEVDTHSTGWFASEPWERMGYKSEIEYSDAMRTAQLKSLGIEPGDYQILSDSSVTEVENM